MCAVLRSGERRESGFRSRGHSCVVFGRSIGLEPVSPTADRLREKTQALSTDSIDPRGVSELKSHTRRERELTTVRGWVGPIVL